MDIEFENAKRKDVPVILQFIKELARYEKLEHEVIANEGLLEQCLFVYMLAEVIFVVKDHHFIGFALFFHNFSTFLGRAGLYLEDLYIKPEYRGHGYGKATIKELVRIAKERGCVRMEWWCLDWNQSSIDFYLSLGAKPMDEWTVYRLTDDDFERLLQ